MFSNEDMLTNRQRKLRNRTKVAAPEMLVVVRI
jgi:hypothetical protein